MYETHFGLQQRPFRPTPDTAYYYPATGHERALAQLVQALTDDEGLALLTGEPGTGKTLLCHCLLERLGSAITSAFLTNSHLHNLAGLLQAILFDLSLPYEGRSEQEMRLALTDFLLKNYGAGQRTVLVLDEAQHLTTEILEELRLLGNLEGPQGKALQIVLVAQPSITELLARSELAAFSQRLAVRTRVEPLDLHEAADYLVHHLRVAGGRPEEIVTDEALEILARETRGIPRLLNRAAHQALTLAWSGGIASVDAEVALEALSNMGLADSTDQLEDNTPQSRSADAGEAASAETSTADEPLGDPLMPLADQDQPRGILPSIAAPEVGRARRLFASPRRPA
jgi:type II secretory pathway predicted ATPase ExeA